MWTTYEFHIAIDVENNSINVTYTVIDIYMNIVLYHNKITDWAWLCNNIPSRGLFC